jgi:hypothetical protein
MYTGHEGFPRRAEPGVKNPRSEPPAARPQGSVLDPGFCALLRDVASGRAERDRNAALFDARFLYPRVPRS